MPFYSRYIPPNQTPESTRTPPQRSEKRKLPREPNEQEKSRKKHKALEAFTSSATQRHDGGGVGTTTAEDVPVADVATAGNTVLDKYRVSSSAKRNQGQDVHYRKSKTTKRDSGEPVQQEEQPQSKTLAETTEDPRANVSSGEQRPSDEGYKKRHADVLSKFRKSKNKGRLNNDIPGPISSDHETLPQPFSEDTHGLEPIPQPDDTAEEVEQPTYSTLPAWQANAVRVVHGTRPKFETLSISENTLNNLKKNDLEQAFPIQSTVIPLLLHGPTRHDGDICVSAATGSGKTLAYVVPMIEALKSVASTKLRGVIVVPTRELVHQVRRMCEMCATGTSLSIVTALGSKSIKEEQKMLVEEEEVYDPEEYEREQTSSIDWSTLSIEKTMRQAQKRTPLKSLNFITRFRSRVDILITTPGRLVDHLRSTPGFNLDHVKWLVVDEADRLLNESYQEWIEAVVPALQSRAATEDQDRFLRYMRMELPERVVTKVLLSATMTSDISKLNSLGLRNPKLVVLGNSGPLIDAIPRSTESAYQEEKLASRDEKIHLPSTLSESTIQVKDGSEKPLVLLELLEKHIMRLAQESNEADASSNISSSSDSDDSGPTSSSESDSESNSDSSSDSDASEDPSRKVASSTSPKHNTKQRTAPKHPRALVFTRSTASATRLARLLSLLSPTLAHQISTLTRSTASSASSRRALSSFRASKTSVLIATDRASRGLDVPDLSHVISYDVPGSALTYVHRVGRTARAGKEGTAWTLVEHREGAWFWREIGGKTKIEGNEGKREGPEVSISRSRKIKRLNLSVDDEDLKKRYEEALVQLGEEVCGQ